jgi:hypothetical protein
MEKEQTLPMMTNLSDWIDKLEPATRDNLDWFEFGYRERMTHLQCQTKDLSVQHVDHKQPNLINLNWEIRVLHELNTKK